MLRKLRITLAIICFTLITLLFLDFTGTLHAWFGWMAKLQFAFSNDERHKRRISMIEG